MWYTTHHAAEISTPIIGGGISFTGKPLAELIVELLGSAFAGVFRTYGEGADAR
ncbi:MAG: hypothetical protein QXG03_13430 [Halalkalicoccus sp.]